MPDINHRKKGGAKSSAFLLALSARCPHCGKGALYDGLLKVHDRCNSCDFPLIDIDTGDGAAAFVILVLGAFLVPMALWVEFHFLPPLWVHILLWPPLITLGAIYFIRIAKAWLIGQQYRHFDKSGGV